MPRTYNEELGFLEKISGNAWRIKKGFVPNMKVPGYSFLRTSNSVLSKRGCTLFFFIVLCMGKNKMMERMFRVEY